MNNLLHVVDLYKSYYDGLTELPVLKGTDLEVKKAEIVAIVGASGVGKSTLLHLIGGLDRPTEGTIFYEGEDIFSLNDQELDRFRNEEIGFVFQFHHLLPELTALENVAMPGLIARQKFDVAQDRAKELLEYVGLLWTLNDQFSQTFIIVTHNQTLAQRADRLIQLVDGQVFDQV